VKNFRLLLVALFIAVLSPACKSDDPPEFGVDEPEGGFFSRERIDGRSRKWHEWRRKTSKREEQKWNQMFDRMKGQYD
jgi:hypothetical protein